MYIFDTSSFSALFGFYPSRFPSLWGQFNLLVGSGEVVSVKEVLNELKDKNRDEYAQNWISENKSCFLTPNTQEASFMINVLFKEKGGHFQGSIDQKKLLKGGACADPFLISKAKINNGIVVTQEVAKTNSTKIPTICEYFSIECTNLEGFMDRQGWVF